MSEMSRRNFIKTTLAAAATITIAGTKSSGKVLGANGVINVAVIGLGGRVPGIKGGQGTAHVARYLELMKTKNVNITYLVDVDPRQCILPAKMIQAAKGPKPKTIQDFRVALADKDLDAISIATPNHWHSLIGILACQAGKDIYIEKPCSHNYFEGKSLVAAAKKYKRIVQHGTQSRAMTDWAKTVEIIKQNKLGKLTVARGLCYKPRPSIGYQQYSPPPKGMDFDLWLGPALQQHHHANLVHYNWHWFWDFGNGEIGNQGVHQMDVARWGIPAGTFPKSVISLGGRFLVDGKGQAEIDQGLTPNTQIAVFDYGTTQLIFEVRGMRTPSYEGQLVGNVFHMEGGHIAGPKGGAAFIAKGAKKPAPLPNVNGNFTRENNFANFLDTMRSRKAENLYAPIEEGHISSTLCHLANISYRLGHLVPLNGAKNPFGANKEANDTFDGMVAHLKANGVNLATESFQMGVKLEIDPKLPLLVKDPSAQELMTGAYRQPFVVPPEDKV